MFRVLVYLFALIHGSVQFCPEEVSKKGIPVTWRESKTANNVLSSPICYYKGTLVTRNCNGTVWSPPIRTLPACLEVVDYYDLTACPPGYKKVSEQNNKYCYQIGANSSWDFPCLKNGGSTPITDLTIEEYKSLVRELNNSYSWKHFWLPGLRQKSFIPMVWHIPGPNWGGVVKMPQTISSLLKKCLLLDIEKGILTTESCNKEFPSLCIYLNDMKYPTQCPNGYYGFRFMADYGTCFGIEKTENGTGLTYDNFLNSMCSKPTGSSKYRELTTFLFMKLAQLEQLPGDAWCWFDANKINFDTEDISQNSSKNDVIFSTAINSNGTVGLANSSLTLPCMACVTEMRNYEETTLELEYSAEEKKLHLTIYFPSGLWKYDKDDNGVQCFSDASGFVRPITVNQIPLIEIVPQEKSVNLNTTNVEKTVFSIDPVTNRSAQYWCEGHNKTLSLLTSTKIVASPRSDGLHVYAVVLKVPINVTFPDFPSIVDNLTISLQAEKVLLMDIINYTDDHILVLMHLHVRVLDEFDGESSNLLATYNLLLDKVYLQVALMNITFINMTSCMYCLPTNSTDYITLDWELTRIGYIAAPKQFCLQSNGLPVKRNCEGSYLLGGIWGDVEGNCNKAYQPSNTTTFLYNFAKAQLSDNYTSLFLTKGLGFVLDDVETIIPADIYYLAVSLQHVLNAAQRNTTAVDMGDIENMGWAMDRILILDKNYLRLAQTFNSTNIILESVAEIIEQLARPSSNSSYCVVQDLQLSIKPKFVAQISYPEFNNITGIALINQGESAKFTDMIIQPLYKNTTIESVLLIENLEVAAWVPETVLNTLKYASNISEDEQIKKEDIHIVITVYYNDAVFQQLDSSKNLVNGRIVGLTIPGFNTNLIHPVPLLFKDSKYKHLKRKCGYWDFQTKESGRNPGYWSDRGCFYKKSERNITVCQCYHLTNFGQLLDLGSYKPAKNGSRNNCHSKALNIITLVGSFLSLFGIFGIWLTALVFRTWRVKPGTKVLLQLSSAIALPLILMIIFNLDTTIFQKVDEKYVVVSHKKIICIVLGALLQYSILASFMWMLITAILQFVRYVRVFGVCRPCRFMLKFTLIGWGIPVLPVAVLLAVDPENFIPEPQNIVEKRICYPSGIYFLLGILLPISLILFVNVTLFLLVLYSISRCPEGKMRITDLDLVGTQLRLSVFLFFLLGLTWLFGILSFTSNLLWSYMFCLTSTLQGFVLFVYFVICDPATRNLWINLMKPQVVSSSRKSITSITSG